ncbi:uncharacterized protein J3R85_006906 [Psidium guajava]|nr:uncharacterized protein J3R85_006906 [Psidium guajava]
MSTVEDAVLEIDDRYLRLFAVRIAPSFVSSFSSLICPQNNLHHIISLYDINKIVASLM